MTDILFPMKCIFCGRILPPGATIVSICGECAPAIPYYAGRYLYESRPGAGSSDSSRTGSRDDSRIGSCDGSHTGACCDGAGSRVGVDTCDRIICALNYTGFVRRAVSGYKFHGRREYGHTLAAILCEKIERAELCDPVEFDFVACVPLSRERLRGRGYNQAEILAKFAAEYFGLPYEGKLLGRDEHTLRQSSLRRAERIGNAQAAFYINAQKARRPVAGARILLIDDIATTMSTLNACAAALKAHGAAEVAGAVLAYPP